MTATETMSIRSVIVQILEESNLHDPREIAAVAAHRLPTQMRRDYLVNALTNDVRSVISERRNRALNNTFAANADPRLQPAQAVASRGGQRSAKVDGIRQWWTATLQSRVHAGPGRWMQLGECGDAELEFAETERRRKAQEQIGYANKYNEFRMLLAEYDVKTVAELPEDAVRQVRT